MTSVTPTYRKTSDSIPTSPTRPEMPSTAPSHQFTIFGLSPVVIAVVSSLAWMSVSSGLIMLNKDLLSHGFPYPMALSGLGMAFSSIASYVTIHHLKLVEAKRQVSPKFFITKILPVGLFMALTLHFGNLVYLHLTVAFVQILKCFTPIITMIALFIAQLEVPSKRLVLSVLCIAFGTGMASLGEVNLNLYGVFIMFLSETFEALRLVMTQILLTGLKFHPIEGLMYLAPACTFWLLLGSLFLELKSMIDHDAFSIIAATPFKFIGAAMMGFGVNSLAYIVIQSASSLTLKVLGTVKNAFVVFLGIFLLGEIVTGLQGLGYATSLAAFFWYQRIKMEQIRDAGSDQQQQQQQQQYVPLSNRSSSLNGGDEAIAATGPVLLKRTHSGSVGLIRGNISGVYDTGGNTVMAPNLHSDDEQGLLLKTVDVVESKETV